MPDYVVYSSVGVGERVRGGRYGLGTVVNMEFLDHSTPYQLVDVLWDSGSVTGLRDYGESGDGLEGVEKVEEARWVTTYVEQLNRYFAAPTKAKLAKLVEAA